jgi:type IV fimbrial biogenesis protein FimT
MHKQRGFSLVETMVVVAIIAVMLGYGVSSYKDWIENSKIRNAAESMLNGLQKARNFAVLNNTRVQFVIGSNTDWYSCINSACPTPLEQRTTQEGSSSSVTVTPTGGTTVLFNNFGTRVSGFTQLDFSSTAIGSPRALRILIKSGGAARLCDPALNISTPTMGCL